MPSTEGNRGEFQSPIPTTLAEQWRCVTVERLNEQRRLTSSDTKQYPAGDNVLYLLSEAFEGFWSEGTKSKLDSIVENACELAVLYGKQKCRVQIFFHPYSAKWKKGQSDVEVMAGDDDAPEANVDFVITPGLRKYGNGHGARLSESAVLCKSWIAIRELDVVE